MKWDIDKAFSAIEHPEATGSAIERVLINDVGDTTHLKSLGLKAPKGVHTGSKMAWVLCLGRMGQRKLFVHGWTIREAFLKARKVQRTLGPEDLAWYGLRAPKKRSNSYASARRKPRKK